MIQTQIRIVPLRDLVINDDAYVVSSASAEIIGAYLIRKAGRTKEYVLPSRVAWVDEYTVHIKSLDAKVEQEGPGGVKAVVIYAAD